MTATAAPFRHDPYAPTPGLDADGRPAADTATAPAPVPVELVWTDREGTRLTGLMNLGPLGRTDSADERTFQATGHTDQMLITGGTRRRTLDAFNDYDTGGPDLKRVTPEEAARALADWCGFTGRPVALKIIDETRM